MKSAILSIVVSTFLSGCATNCISMQQVCADPNTERICSEVKDGCQHCYCQAKPGSNYRPSTN